MMKLTLKRSQRQFELLEDVNLQNESCCCEQMLSRYVTEEQTVLIYSDEYLDILKLISLIFGL